WSFPLAFSREEKATKQRDRVCLLHFLLPPLPPPLPAPLSIERSIDRSTGDRLSRRMGLLFVQVLPRGNGDLGSPAAAAAVFQCRRCRLDAASTGDLLSKEFFGRRGRGYLFDRVVNITLGPNEVRKFTTGFHTVNDIYCICCQEIIGWRYEKAYEESQKYKEGKFIMERTLMCKEAP
ncbi:unnamed protein product, partial [Urochloa humidicola]